MADPPAALPAHGGLLLTTTGGSATTLLRHATKLSAVTVGAGHIFCGDEQGEVCGWALHSLETVELSGEPHVGAVVALQAIAPTLNDPHRSQPLLFSAAADDRNRHRIRRIARRRRSNVSCMLLLRLRGDP